jgi:hypothetical protein
MSVAIQAEIECTVASCLNGAESVYFSEIKSRIERNTGGSIGDGFLASSIERHGWTVHDKAQPWTVTR